MSSHPALEKEILELKAVNKRLRALLAAMGSDQSPAPPEPQDNASEHLMRAGEQAAERDMSEDVQ